MRLMIVPVLALLGSACDGGDGGFVVGQEAVADCPISDDLASLDGTVWLMDEAMPDKTNRLNPQARLKFFTEDGKPKALYTVKSGFDIYDYECKANKDNTEYACAEPARVVDWCQALEVYEPESCRLAKMKEFGAPGTDEEINKQIAEAKATVAKYRNTENWNQFRANNNNLANKLQGLLWAKPNKTRCNLRIQDMYMTVYNGKRMEDSNPVGTNPFGLSTDEFQWDHCDNGNTLADATSATKPPVADVGAGKFQHETGKDVFYHYYGEKGLDAKDGCTYSMTTFAQWRPIGKDVEVKKGEDGKLVWTASHTFTPDDHTDWFNAKIPQGIFAMSRYETCAGEKKKIDTVCNTAKVMIIEAASTEG